MVKFIADNFDEFQNPVNEPNQAKGRMNRYLLVSILFFGILSSSQAQKISGQWKGEFWDKSSEFGSFSGDKCEYVLELEANGSQVTGYSYTYFYYGDAKYYTICKLSGTYNKAKKYVEVREFERTKTNVPRNLNNCFQIHKLVLSSGAGGDESLSGSWVPAPNQSGNCGYGSTLLTRRNLKAAFPGLKNPAPGNVAHNNISRVNSSAKRAPVTVKKASPPVVKKSPVVKAPVPPAKSEPVIAKKDSIAAEKEIRHPKQHTSPVIIAGSKYEKRNNTILKTIDIENNVVKVDLYDNGEIDGDSISVFLNGKLLLSHQRLTAQPLSIKLQRDELESSNDLVMYAENLGSIPPNTALMVVTDGTKRYEVRITSDLQKSGAIRFIKK